MAVDNLSRMLYNKDVRMCFTQNGLVTVRKIAITNNRQIKKGLCV